MFADLNSHLSEMKSKVNLNDKKFDRFALKNVANVS